MASLADELLADLEPEGAGAAAEDAVCEPAAPAEDGTGVPARDAPLPDEFDTDADGGDAHEPMDEAALSAVNVGADSVDTARSLSRLHKSSMLMGLIEQSIDGYMAQPPPQVASALEGTPEYFLIVKANNVAVDVDNEVMMLHKFIRERYAPRFPELETLVLNPWEFIQAVRALGNEKDLLHASLDGILPHGTVVVISMTASATTGRPLADEEWARVQEACDMVYDLEATRHKILAFVESRMTLLAPNLSALVGTGVATKLVGVAGGLAGLAKIPSCNMHLLGASKKQSMGLSTIHGGSTKFSGFVSQCDLVARTPDDYRTQALRMVSAKVSLAVRMDVTGSPATRSGSYGAGLHEEIAHKLEKLMEPPPTKLIKALPVPSEGGRKQRRGGRRARKFREMNGITELRKMQNRVEFGKQEEEAGAFDETVGLGMVNTKSSGKIRAAVADAKSKAKLSKANKGRLATLNRPNLSLHTSAPTSSSLSGTASSLSFTPVQGIELVDPSRQKKVEEANAKWFREGQFSLLPGATGSRGSTVPGLAAGADGKTAPSMPPPPPP
ncbi:U4/U6-U5 snRNP complex subunit prp31 [Malassezia sp. CBS 17886]|nr:U4/U6-U5 snRNP complex subunit prp31 [Malassezia sp. CBS 17886]